MPPNEIPEFGAVEPEVLSDHENDSARLDQDQIKVKNHFLIDTTFLFS